MLAVGRPRGLAVGQLARLLIERLLLANAIWANHSLSTYSHTPFPLSRCFAVTKGRVLRMRLHARCHSVVVFKAFVTILVRWPSVDA